MKNLKTRTGLALVALVLLTSALPLSTAAQRRDTPLWVDRISASHATGRELADPLRLTVDVHVTARGGAVSGALVSIVVIDPAGERTPTRATTGRDGFAHITTLVPGGGPYEVVVMDVIAGGYFYDPYLDTHTFPGYFIPPVGTVYVSLKHNDSGLRRIQQFTGDGEFVREWDQVPTFPITLWLQGSFSIAVDPAGYVYGQLQGTDVSGSPSVCEVHKYTSYGALVNTLGGVCGSGQGQFLAGHDLTVDSSGNLYVLDWNPDDYGKRILIFDANGNHLSTWSEQHTINHGVDMEVDQEGHLYMLDTLDGTVHMFTQTGVHLASWPAPDGRKIAIDSGNRIFVTYYDTSAVVRDGVRIYTSTGQLIADWKHLLGPASLGAAIAIDANDDVYLTNSSTSPDSPHIGKFTANGNILLTWDVHGIFPEGYIILDIAVYRYSTWSAMHRGT